VGATMYSDGHRYKCPSCKRSLRIHAGWNTATATDGVNRPLGNRQPNVAQTTNTCAIIALVFALLVSVPLAAIIFGFVAKFQVEESNGTQRGEGLAYWAIVLGFIELLGILMSLVALHKLG
jgi:hypothetical protein